MNPWTPWVLLGCLGAPSCQRRAPSHSEASPRVAVEATSPTVPEQVEASPAPEEEAAEEGERCVGPVVDHLDIVSDHEVFAKAAAANVEAIWTAQAKRATPPSEVDRDAMAADIAEAQKAVADLQTRGEADFDGDGKADTIEFVRAASGTSAGMLVRFASGRVHLLGAGRPTKVRFGGPANRAQRQDEEFWPEDEWEEMADCEPNYAFVQGWSIAKRARRGEVASEIGRFQPSGIVGDAILLDSGDSFALYYFDGSEWKWVHPGV